MKSKQFSAQITGDPYNTSDFSKARLHERQRTAQRQPFMQCVEINL